MAADASTKLILPSNPEPLLPVLRKPPKSRSLRRTPYVPAAADSWPARPNLTPLALAQSKRPSRIILAGSRKTEAGTCEALDRAAELICAQVFLIHHDKAPETCLSQAHNLPPMPARAAAELMGKASAFVALSGEDAEDAFLQEAAAQACPLILPDNPAMRSRWDGAAIFVRLEDKSACADALRRMLEDPEHRQRMALAAWRRAQDLAAMKPAAARNRARTLTAFA